MLARIDALQTRYLAALDRRNWSDWLACFSSDGSYICTSQENVGQDLPLAIMMDDTRERLADRVKFITEVWSGTYEDYSTRHFVQRLTCEREAPDLFAVQTNFTVIYTNSAGRTDLLVAGVYRDAIRVGPSDTSFKTKVAILDTFTTPRYLVYPV
jgi:anthranilate 1,2-dioxygenase small subunit